MEYDGNSDRYADLADRPSETNADGPDGPSRRDFMKATAGTIGGAALPAGAATGQAPTSTNVLLDEDFEGYATGSYPGSWRKNGNEDQKVVDSTAAEGSKSLRLKGSPGGCWEALANAPISLPDSGTVTFSGYVKPTSDGAVGCHDNKRGSIKLRTSADGWSSGSRTRLLKFHLDGTISGPGIDLGSYQVDEWNSFEVTYERSNSSVQLSYVVNGESRGSTTRAVASYEDDLSYLCLTSGDFSIYYDDLRAAETSGASGPGVETRDFTGDGEQDVKIWNGNVWLMLEGRHRDSKVFASRVGQSGSHSSGGPWFFKPTDRSANQLRHRSTESVDPFETSDGVGYHLRRTHDLAGTPFEEVTTVFLPEGAESALVRVRLTNAGSSDVVLDQQSGHIHDGIMMVKGVPLNDRGSDYRFHSTGSGTHSFDDVSTWEVFDLSGTYPTITAFDSSDAISYGLVDGSTGPRMAITNGDPPVRVDFMVKALTLGGGETARYTLAVGAHDGGSTAPSRASDAVSDAASETGSIPKPGGDSNESPTAAISVSPSTPTTGDTVTFDASESSDPDGSIQSVRWDLDGDGTDEASGMTVDHAYDEAGEYEVSVTVADGDGETDTARTAVTVEAGSKPDVAFEFSPSDPRANEEVTFDASASSDPDGQIDVYEWDFDGDGTVDAHGQTVAYTYEESGSYTVALTVVDDDGNEAFTTGTVSVGESTAPEPSFSVSPDGPSAGEEVTFDASASSDLDGSIAMYEWDLTGDEAVDATGETVTHTFEEPGEYTVTLVLTDDGGATASVSKQISVGGKFASAKKQKLSTADAVDGASVLSSMQWFGDDVGDRAIARTTIGQWESALSDGSVDTSTATGAVERLHAAEVATRDALSHVGPAGNGTLNFARRLASNASSVLLDLLLMKLSIANKILRPAPAWVAGTIKSTIGTTIEDGIVGLLGDFLNLADARTKTKKAATSEMDAVWQTVKDGATDLASVMADAVDAILDTVTVAVRASVEFFSVSPLTHVSSPPDDLRDVVMGNSIWSATFDLHEGLRPSALDGGLPGSTATAIAARDEGVELIDQRLQNVASNLDAFNATIGDVSIYESIQDLLNADDLLDGIWELGQMVVDVAIELAGIVIDATATLAAGISLWMTRKIHDEIVASVVSGENRIGGWPVIEV